MTWSGDPSRYGTWKANLLANDRNSGEVRVGAWVRWAKTQQEKVTTDPIDVGFGEQLLGWEADP